MTVISKHTATADVVTASGRLRLPVKDAQVTLDEAWAPYVQASLTCSTPEPAVLAQIDPRTRTRVHLTLEQRFGESQPASALSAAYAGASAATFSAAYAGQNAVAVSNDYGQPYNAFGMRPSTRRRFNLGLRTRHVDSLTGTMRLDLASNEATAQDQLLVAKVPSGAPGPSVAQAVDFALLQIGESLGDAIDYSVPGDADPDAFVWLPGVSAWAYADGLVKAAGLRLWCDELRRWHLTEPLLGTGRLLAMTTSTTALSEDLDREGQWHDAVVVEYRWNNASGEQQTRYDVAGATRSNRALHVLADRAWPGAGAANAILQRARGRGRKVVAQAVSDYSATPGDQVNIRLTDSGQNVGIVSSVTWNLSADEMTVTTRDLTETSIYSWAYAAPGLAWDEIPSGTDWTEYDPTEEV